MPRLWNETVGQTRLGYQEDVFAGNTRILDPLTDLVLVTINQCGIDVPAADDKENR